MTFAEDAALARDESFRDQVLVSLLKTATNIAAEAYAEGTDYSTYRRRADLATNVLNVPQAHRESWAWAIAAQPGIDSSGPVSDPDIEYTVVTMWDHFAGVVDAPPTPQAQPDPAV